MNFTKAGFAASYFVSHTYWQVIPERIISANVDPGTAAGINALRLLKAGCASSADGSLRPLCDGFRAWLFHIDKI